MENRDLVVVNQIVSEMNTDNSVPMVSSLDVARRFGKQHKDVLRSIEAMEIPQEVFERNFAPKTYGVKKGRGNGYISQEPYYMMTRRGFSVLVMGFTGKEALKWKWIYAEAFDRMEEELRKRSAPQFDIPQTYGAALMLAAKRQYSSSKQQHLKLRHMIAICPQMETSD